MVKVRTWISKDGTKTGNSIRLGGLGDEETAKMTLQFDKVLVGETITGNKNGRDYSFEPRKIGVIYHKGDEDIECSLELTEPQQNKLEKLGLEVGKVVEGYKTEINGKTAIQFREVEEGETPSDSPSLTEEEKDLIENMPVHCDNEGKVDEDDFILKMTKDGNMLIDRAKYIYNNLL